MAPRAVPPALRRDGVWLWLPRCVGMHRWNHLIHTVNVTGLMSGKESLGTKGGGGVRWVCVDGWVCRECVCVCVCVWVGG